ncbi:MAG: 50S ribosomal protein L4 [Candidatus Diapherotrites archaeon]|nr:50S ribosomal protein L4 [Candidatus Diapherotrites archaeon]
MKANVYSLEGQKMKEITLPEVFSTNVDLNLIKRAFLSIHSAMIQPKGHNNRAGKEQTAVYRGARGRPGHHRIINNEMSRLPRMKNRRFLIQGTVAGVPNAVGGPRVHKLLPEKTQHERINKKEKRLATKSAIAGTALKDLILKRGHKFGGTLTFPVILEDKFEQLERTKQVSAVLEKLDLMQDVEKAKSKKKIRAGRGKSRGRKYKRAKSLLVVASNTDKIYKAARNLEGVEVSSVKDLNAYLLAPGAQPGRLTIFTESAINYLNGN